MRKIMRILLLLSMVSLFLSSCTSTKIPQLTDIDEASARNILTSSDLTAAIRYEYSDDVAKGCVIRSKPEFGSSVQKRSVVTLYVSNGPKLTVPDIVGVDEATAKTILASALLIPNVQYEYDDQIEKGCVIRTRPAIGKTVEPNSKITLYISKGPSYILSSDSRISWHNISYGQDTWEFYNPYISEDKLYINCSNVVFAANVKWVDNYNEGYLIGTASVNDTYEKTVPVYAEYSKQEWKAGEAQAFTLEIPLNDLDIDKPTSMCVELFAEINGRYDNVEITFTIAW